MIDKAGFLSESQCQRFSCRDVLTVGYSRHVEHPLGCDDAGGIGVFILHKDHLFDTALDDGLGAFVAWEKSDVDGSSFEGAAVVVQNGV